MTARQVAVGDFTEEQIRVQRAGEALHRDGASPAGALELLSALVEDRTWERLADARGRSFKGRFRDFVETRSPFGLGYETDQLRKLLALRHPHESHVPAVAKRMTVMREEIGRLLHEEIPPAAPHGQDRRSQEFQESGTHLNTQAKRDAAAVLARLKRDDPELAEKVISGKITSNAAAREKGWRRPRIILSTPERTAESIRKYMPREARQRLAELLLTADEPGEQAARGDRGTS